MYISHSYRQEVPEPAPSLSWDEVPIGGIQVFFYHQNNPDLFGAFVYCGLREKINTCETLIVGRFLFAFVSMHMVGKNLNNPNKSSMTDDTMGWYGSSTRGATRMSRGYQACPKIHVIRVVFQVQALYARTSFRGAKTF